VATEIVNALAGAAADGENGSANVSVSGTENSAASGTHSTHKNPATGGGSAADTGADAGSAASGPVFALHRGGKLEVTATVPVRDAADLSLAYTPGVAEVCTAIAERPELVHDYTWKSQVVAVVTDGTAVLGLGDIGPEASLPVMEGKAILFKQFGGVDAVPIALACTDTDEIVETVVRLAPSFGGVNLEDISAPRCFEIERRLKDALDIPVFHDDQHGTAVVTLAALRNAARLTGRKLGELRAVISGAGAAGVAIARIWSRRASATSRSPTARASSTPAARTSTR
jgi:malate dehydrogenase (oxaloacetate-decarboxylating)